MKLHSSLNARQYATVSTLSAALVIALGSASLVAVAGGSGERTTEFKAGDDYSHYTDWLLKAENLVPYGQNPYYFPFKPGFKFVMEKPDHPDGPFRKEVIVLNETEPFDLTNMGIGKFEAAAVQEDEFFEGRWTQQAINWFVMDKTTGSVYSLGELSWEVDDEGNKVFEGTWRVGEPDGNGFAEPGLLMPGTFNLGGRYIYDGSESESLGGSINMESGITIETPAGTFENCVRVREQNLTHLDDVTDKVWCPGVGLVSDTSDGLLIASDIIPGKEPKDFGKFHEAENVPQFEPPVAKITSEEAVAIGIAEVPGEVTSVSIERKRKKNVYVVEIQAEPDGRETDVFVDIESGEVVGIDK
jgi:hypothetical protein